MKKVDEQKEKEKKKEKEDEENRKRKKGKNKQWLAPTMADDKQRSMAALAVR